MADAVFHSWSAQDLIDPITVVSGEGSYFYDDTGTAYLDFSSQLMNVNVGHRHPTLVRAMEEQLNTLPTIQPAVRTPIRTKLAELIADAAPGELNYVFFTNGGADANENAVRMAREHTGRSKVLSAYRSYHGATSTAISLTGDPRRWAVSSGDSSVVHFFGPYLYRSAFHATTEEEECARALEHLENVIQLEGPDTIAAIILETVVGTNGILVPPAGYLPGVRALCDKYGIVYIADEVMVGFGRTGTMFAVEHFDVTPDLITFAKGVNSGYVPLGGVIISEEIRNSFATRPYPGGLTYSGHPLACAPGVATFTVFEEEDVLAHTRTMGETVVRPRLEKLARTYPIVGEVRGLGLFWAIELVRDRATREPLVPFNASGPQAEPVSRIVADIKKQGVWPFSHFNRIHMAPPLNISEADLHRGLDAYEAAIAAASQSLGASEDPQPTSAVPAAPNVAATS
ncbi:5-aminovalerate aminotransferase DavT [Corynebacterium ciconiae DSM 44920]|uniref:aspartate aminotransferase family protein n=1 Tax=Corynebacterium ciconiae TaxID=227319 RepID=UPI00037BC6E9|nr:aspartate aminotransferase family protein [Corynebacterium ciconiae]WKD61353.1 5-aminovalerate aminotransferase DavT [Corynebacterium ciconiae DSM 44920]